MLVLLLLVLAEAADLQHRLNTSWNGEHCSLGKEQDSCSCESSCALYGNCCPDSQFFIPEQQIQGASRYFCRTIQHKHVYVLGASPQGNPCQYVDDRFFDPLLDVPVTSSRTNLTYINSDCAISSSDFDAATDALWNIQFTCGEDFEAQEQLDNEFGYEGSDDDIFLEAKRQSLSCVYFNDTASEWKLDVSCLFSLYFNISGEDYVERDDLGSLSCKTEPLPPKHIEIQNVRCDPKLIVGCPEHWADVQVLNMCEAYQDVFQLTTAAYRNPYCAYCWGEALDTEEAKRYDYRHQDYDYDYSVEVVNDTEEGAGAFSLILDQARLSQSKCRPDWKYDFREHSCRFLNISATNTNETGETSEAVLVISRVSDKRSISLITYIGLSISVTCLVLHLVVFFATPKLSNLPSMNLASLSTSLLLLYICFLVGQFLDPPCVTLAVLMHFALTALFCWMFVISFDVWRVVRKSTRTFERSRGSKWKRFAVYSLVAWAVPAGLVTAALLLQVLQVDTELRPDYGVTNCWISSSISLLSFVVAPLCVVMFLNLWFFSWSAWLIHKTRTETAGKSTATTDFRLFLRLAIIMGLTWITGVVATFVSNDGMWYLFVLLNTLQGLFIFLGFSCNKKLWSELKTCCRTSEQSEHTTKL